MALLTDALIEHAARQPDAEALVSGRDRLTYREFDERVNRLASGLAGLGLRPGDHVALLLGNRGEYLEAYYALSKAGMVAVPLNTRLSEAELAYILDHSGSRALVTEETHAATARRLGDKIEGLSHLIGVGGEGLDGMIPYEAVLSSGRAEQPAPTGLDEDRMLILMYTGGTTGFPKGVMLSHRNLLASIRAIGAALGFTGGRTLMALPLFHIANWQAFLFHQLGGSVVVSPTAAPADILDLLERYRPVFVNLVPTVYQSMLDLPGIDEADFSYVVRFTTSGAAMPPETLRRCAASFGARFGAGYGLTEAAPAVTSLGPEQYALEGEPARVRRSASVGTALPGVRVAVRREDGTECATEEPGEISVAGDNVMRGYWRDPERTREALRDGWLHTGDIGYLDEDGFLYLIDRKGDMIVSGGENVYPTETENALSEHPAVREVAVVGAPDPKWGERVTAVVALEPGADVTEGELIRFCRERIAGYKCPKSIDFVDVLPKSPVGKILRREVRKRYDNTSG